MTIEKTINGSVITIALGGRLDTNTSKDLEKELSECLPGCTDLTFDLKDLEYTSSAGLRVFLNAQKIMNKQGEMLIVHCTEAVMEIFDVTGFVDILTIDQESMALLES